MELTTEVVRQAFMDRMAKGDTFEKALANLMYEHARQIEADMSSGHRAEVAALKAEIAVQGDALRTACKSYEKTVNELEVLSRACEASTAYARALETRLNRSGLIAAGGDNQITDLQDQLSRLRSSRALIEVRDDQSGVVIAGLTQRVQELKEELNEAKTVLSLIAQIAAGKPLDDATLNAEKSHD